jgi:hypothetical protein
MATDPRNKAGDRQQQPATKKPPEGGFFQLDNSDQANG